MAERVEFLLEIGCEEIPAGWFAEPTSLTEQLHERFQEIAGGAFVDPLDVRTYSTPRRLTLRAEVLPRQPDREEPVWGPSLKVAKDTAGNWTKAAEGFAKKCGVALSELGQKPKDASKPEELNLVFVKKAPGAVAGEVLPSVIAATLRALAFPKRMSWDAWLDDGKGALPFGRPIRWLLALLGGKVVPFTIYELVEGAKGHAIVQAGNVTYGHRFLPRGKPGAAIAVDAFRDYRDKLRENFVLVDVQERRERIQRAGVPLSDDHGLRQEWPQLVEYPTVVSGAVPERFHFLPNEVLETVLVHHQKYIPRFAQRAASEVLGQRVQPGLTARSAPAVAGFFAVTNTDERHSDEIVRGMERVCVARFRDAAFFYEEDRKRPLESRVEDLKGVTFHQKLGSYHEKVQRMARLVDFMRERGWLDEEWHRLARRAALLAKADLTTQMVREFTELQGVMGGIYLRLESNAADGDAGHVWRAIQHQYHLGELAEGLPAGPVFGALVLADRLDTLAGYFSIGASPRGSSDPYGLRRAALACVRVLLKLWPDPDLKALLVRALDEFTFPGENPRSAVEGALEPFLRDRLAFALREEGFAAGEVESVLAAAADALARPADALRRVRALQRVRAESRADFDALAEAFKRANNILAGQQPAERVEAKLFQRESERELHAAVERAAAAQQGRDYEARLRALAALREPVDRFFAREQDGGVMVMADDPAVRANRLALLARARRLFHDIADISKLGGSQ